jgi:hypothetical protein
MVRALAVTVLGLFAMGSGQAPSPDRQSSWQSLFDGKTLTGWQPSERPESWKIEDGAIVTSGDRSHLFYVGPVANHTFKNFEFSAEVMATPGSNSGISGCPTTTDDTLSLRDRASSCMLARNTP